MESADSASRPAPPSESNGSLRRHRSRRTRGQDKGKGKGREAETAVPTIPEGQDGPVTSRSTAASSGGVGLDLEPDWVPSDRSEKEVPMPEVRMTRAEELEALRAREMRKQTKQYGLKLPKTQLHPRAFERLTRPRKPKPPPDPSKANYNNWGSDTYSDPGAPPASDVDDDPYNPHSSKKKKAHRNLPAGSHVLGQRPNGMPPNQGHGPTLPRIPPNRMFGAQLTPAAQDSDSTAPARAASHARADHNTEIPQTSLSSNASGTEVRTQMRADAPAFEPGKPVPPHLCASVASGNTVPPHLRASTVSGANPAGSSAQQAPPTPAQTRPQTKPKQSNNNARAPAPPTQPSRAQPSRSDRRGDDRRGNNRGKGKQPRIQGFAQVKEPTGMKFPTIKNFKPRTNTFKGPEDIMTRIHREIGSGSYECAVCYGNLTRKARIWSCSCCYGVYHLHCIQKWARQGLEKPPTRPIGSDGEPTRTWRCPSCNNPEEQVPAHYTCWCGKSVNPEASKFLPPHSCGQTCGKKRPEGCPHACPLQCHAGPCPPCSALGPAQNCFCGKESSQRRCVDTDYENGWSCGRICEDFMPCGEHTCLRQCHSGLCGACEVEDLLRCYCGAEIREIKCCDKQDPSTSQIEADDGEFDEWEGYFACEKVCDRTFDCGIHRCKKPCHPQDAQQAHCPLSPDVVKTCPCGQTNLEEILPIPRSSCEDPIPSCSKTCKKILPCGHEHMALCHEGDCGACLKKVEITCRCSRTTLTTLCHQGVDFEPPQCFRQCRTVLNCNRHECGDKCCSGEPKAQERLGAKKKKAFTRSTPGLQNDDGFEPEHICTRVCGKLLKCGKHNCPMLCHRGPCGTCLEASFDELTCNCGRTVIEPPVPCGTESPPCHYLCAREKDCGHPAVSHECHPDSEKCPPCPFLVEKPCKCKKKMVKAVQCWREGVSCGSECGAKLSCGVHQCHIVCHSANEKCEEPCVQECGKKRICGHLDTEPCHAPFPCSEEKPCQEKIQLACACGGIKQDVKCTATKTNPAGNKKELTCTDQCRSRRLALALELDPDRESVPPYSDETITDYKKDAKWCEAIEKKMRAFLETSSQKEMRFQPMNKARRQFIHLLAADYGIDSESRDREPYRSAFLFKAPKFAGATPRKTIAEYIASLPPEPSTTPASAALQQLRKPRQQAVNAILLQGVRVGLLQSELEKELKPALADSLLFGVAWHGDEDVLLEPKPSSLGPEQTEAELRSLAPRLRRAVAAKGLANSAELCWVGRDGKIVNRENENWSLVANRKAAPTPPTVPNVASLNGFAVFAGGAAAATTQPKPVEVAKKKPKAEVVDDWQMEAESDSE